MLDANESESVLVVVSASFSRLLCCPEILSPICIISGISAPLREREEKVLAQKNKSHHFLPSLFWTISLHWQLETLTFFLVLDFCNILGLAYRILPTHLGPYTENRPGTMSAVNPNMPTQATVN